MLFDQLSVHHVGTEGKNWVNGLLMEPWNNHWDPRCLTSKLIGTNCSCQFNFLSKARAVIHLIFICLVSGGKTDKALNKENWLTSNGGVIVHRLLGEKKSHAIVDCSTNGSPTPSSFNPLHPTDSLVVEDVETAPETSSS